MEKKMIEKYLIERKDIVSKQIEKLNVKIEHNSNVLEENTSDNEISTVQPTMEAEETSQSKSPCDAPESPNRDLQ